MESEMTKMKTLYAGIAAVTMLAPPAFAQEATQEPGAMGQHYPNSDFLTGGYGSRASVDRTTTSAGSPRHRIGEDE